MVKSKTGFKSDTDDNVYSGSVTSIERYADSLLFSSLLSSFLSRLIRPRNPISCYPRAERKNTQLVDRPVGRLDVDRF